MEEKKFEFGKNYVVLDYKIKKLQQNSATTASFSVDEETFVATLNLFNDDNLKINETSYKLPLRTLVVSAEHLTTVSAQEGDLAWVSDEAKKYVFKDGEWIEYIEEE